ncbi:MAG: hypothetical protein ACKV2O_04150 [Acidimicrobiales bacterium]
MGWRRLLGVVVFTGGTAASVLSLAEPALAGGMWMSTVADRHEPGDHVVLIGYSIGDGIFDNDGGGGGGGPEPEFWARLSDGPFVAMLTTTPISDTAPVSETAPAYREVGEVLIEPTGIGGNFAYRLMVGFPLPEGLAPGQYLVGVCARTCDNGKRLGDLVGGSLYVGVDPPQPLTRMWPLDEPAIADLSPEALISPLWPQPVTAAEALRGGFDNPPWWSGLALKNPVTYPPPAANTPPSAPPVPPTTVPVSSVPVSPTTTAMSTTVSTTQVSTHGNASSPLPAGGQAISLWPVGAAAAVALAGFLGVTMRRRRGGMPSSTVAPQSPPV